MARVAWHLGDDGYVRDTALAASSRGHRGRFRCKDECRAYGTFGLLETRLLPREKMYLRAWSGRVLLHDREEAP